MENLPNVSAFEITKEMNNSMIRYYGKDDEFKQVNSKESIISKINHIFASNNHVYKSRVRIKLKNDIIERMIVGKTSTELLTLKGEKIKIIDIVDIEKI